MVIHNASFVIEREHEEEFIGWFRDNIGCLGLSDCGSAGCNPRLSAMREAGGVDYSEAEAQSVAFQVEFPTVEAARRWSEEKFAPLVGRFHAKFGDQVMVFTSLFETIKI